jgi:hypothetical protein
LLDEDEVVPLLDLLEGPSAQIVAALRRSVRANAGQSNDHDGDASRLRLGGSGGAAALPPSAIDTEAFLGQIPASHKAFAAARLAGPEMESKEEAKGYLLENANKLKRLLLSEEAAEFTRETYRAQGDFRTEGDLLKEASDRLRAKRGIKV